MTPRWRLLAISLLTAVVAACDSVEERIEKHYSRGVELVESDEIEKAWLEFRNALQLDENHAPSRFEIGKLYEADRELQAAVANYQLVVELDETHFDANLRLAQIYIAAGELEGAKPPLDRALALRPQDPGALAVKALLALREGDGEAAVETARAALAVDPGYASAHVVLVSERRFAGDLDAARALNEQALAAAPDDLTLNVLMLQILEQQQDVAAMETQLVALSERFSGEPQFQRMLAQHRFRQGDEAGALTVMTALADADPADVETTLDMARLIGRTDGAQAAYAAIESRLAAAPDAETEVALAIALANLDVSAGRVDAARARLRTVTARHEGDVARLPAEVRLGQLALVEGDAAQARTMADAVLEADASNVDARLLRARLLIDEMAVEEAIDDLRAALDVEPDNTSVLLMSALAYERIGNRDLAGQRLAAATRASDYQPAIAVRYAAFLLGRDQATGAESVLLEALRRTPQDPTLLMSLAELRLRQEDWEGAQEIVGALRQLGDDSAGLASRVEAASLNAQGRFAESIDVLQSLGEGTADDQGAMTALVQAYVRNGDVAQARTFLDDAIAQSPDNLRAMLLRADVHLFENEVAEAEAMVERMIATAPANPVGYRTLARLALAQGREADAETVLRQGVDAATPPAALQLELAQMLERRRDFDGAIEQYEAIYESQRDSLVVANNLASLLAEHRGDDPASLERASLIAQRLRGSAVPEFQDTLGWIQYLQGAYNTALRNLAPAAAALPDNPWVRYHAGMAFKAAAQNETARTHLTAALALDPAFPRRVEAQAALDALDAAAEERSEP